MEPFSPGTQRTPLSTDSAGQTSDEPLTWAVTPQVTVGVASGVVLAAATGTGRVVALRVDSGADVGVRINFGAPATATSFLLGPGDMVILPTEQEIRAIRGGGTDVTLHVMSGVV